MNKLMVLMGVAVLFISMEVSLAALTDTCLEDSDCDVTNAECVTYDGCNNGTCNCMEDYVVVAGACKATKMQGETCDADTDQCASNLECSGDTPMCVCATGSWNTKQMKCFADDEYKAIDEECTTDAQCQAHDSGNAAAYTCPPDGGSGRQCKCNDNYFKDDATDKCWKKTYEVECTPGAAGSENAECKGTLECRDDNGSNKCLCAAATQDTAAEKWNAKRGECVADSANVGLVKDAECDADNECGDDLKCMRCPLEAATVSKKCRPLKSGGGSGSSEETSGVAHIAAGVATIFLSAVAMLL